MKKTTPKKDPIPRHASLLLLILRSLLLVDRPRCAQDWVQTGTNPGVQRIRLAAADFKPASSDPQTPHA